MVRAEASADDPHAALDMATTRLLERLRRARDRRKDHHRSLPGPVDVHEVEVPEPAQNGHLERADDGRRVAEDGSVEMTLGDSPIVIREKVHRAHPMTVDDALYEMEMVGHDFYLFIDVETALPSVVYRRRGWSYGVIRLDTQVVAARAG